MKRSHLLCFALLSAIALPVVACANPDSEAVDTGEDELISFPTAIFANAPTISYGQSLSNQSFRKADLFSAAKFMAAAGDRITGTVTADANKKSIVYVVRKEGTRYVNVKAGGVDTRQTNIVTHVVDRAGEYFLVYRTVPRTDATFSVALEKAGGLAQRCADAGVTPTLTALAAASQSGSAPHVNRTFSVGIERRFCTYATGCTVEKTFNVQLPSFDYVATKQGANFGVVTTIVSRGGLTLNQAGLISGSTLVELNERAHTSTSVPITGTVSATCATVDKTFTKVPIDNETYVEFAVLGVNSQSPWPNLPHPAAAPLPATPELELFPDEEVLALFPRGATELQLGNKPLLQGVGAGTHRNCHPLTSCSPDTDLGNDDASACMRYFTDANGAFIILQKAKVVGRDQYALVTNQGQVITIQDGIGTYNGATLRVGETQMQITYPARNIAMSNEVQHQVSNTTCTFAFKWPVAVQ